MKAVYSYWWKTPIGLALVMKGLAAIRREKSGEEA
jgi:hypothetical protein